MMHAWTMQTSAYKGKTLRGIGNDKDTDKTSCFTLKHNKYLRFFFGLQLIITSLISQAETMVKLSGVNILPAVVNGHSGSVCSKFKLIFCQIKTTLM